jgi:hypothetical protein
LCKCLSKDLIYHVHAFDKHNMWVTDMANKDASQNVCQMFVKVCHTCQMFVTQS